MKPVLISRSSKLPCHGTWTQTAGKRSARAATPGYNTDLPNADLVKNSQPQQSVEFYSDSLNLHIQLQRVGFSALFLLVLYHSGNQSNVVIIPA